MHNITSKKLFIILFALFFLWKNGVQEFVWQQLYSSAIVEKNDEEPALVESITPIENPPIEKMHIGGEDIYMKKVVKYQTWARAMYVDIYDRNFYIGFRPLSAKFDKFYNEIAQLDISLFTGETAKDGNWQKFDVKHDYRVFMIRASNVHDMPVFNNEEVSNNHTIPANKNIRRAFDIIKKGRLVYLEGYWVDWWGKVDGMYDISFDSPREIGQYHDKNFLYGGQITGKCRQIYVTKVIYNGYVYE